MIEKKITCDHCHREKQEANKWWLINGVTTEGYPAGDLYVLPFHRAKEPDIAQGMHACSRECAHKIIEQWMSQTEGQ